MHIHIVVLCLRGQIGIGKRFLRRGKIREKPLRARERTNNKLNPHTYGINNGFQTRATSVGGKCSHQLSPLCLTTLPPLPPCSCSLTWEFWSLKVSFLLQMMEIGFILLNGKEQQKSLHGKGWGFFTLNQ